MGIIIDGGIPAETKNPSRISLWTLLRTLILPRHRKAKVSGKSVADCLRKLERAVGLPGGDLSQVGEPIDGYVGLTVFGRSIPLWTYTMYSKTDTRWRAEDRGWYVYANVVGPKSGSHFMGRIHVSRCDGAFAGNRCNACGYYSND